MNQQHEMYYDYPNASNRSPSSTRQGYATVGLSGLGGARGQRHLDSMAQNPSVYGEDRFGGASGYDTMSRIDRLAPNANYMLENSQTWGYNNGGVATMNGPLNGNGRLSSRSSARRPGLPSTWTEQAAAPMPSMNQYYDHNIPGEHDIGSITDSRGLNTPGSMDEQLIPTAIVIKNIQFQCRKEILQGLMASLNLPQPYAFNYHFDKGVFRGLAFANFSTPEDTHIVIQKMNGLEVMGRKLRVEYKKMLPQEERDRIDREKREKRGQLEEQHRAPMPQHQQSALQALGVGAQKPNGSPIRKRSFHSPTLPAAVRSLVPGDIDLNNPKTLEFYTELTMFQRDTTKESYIFSPDISPEERRQIHILAHNMGLEHHSIGENDRRQLQITKKAQQSPPMHAPHQLPPNVSWEDHRRGLSRAATFDFAESRIGAGSAYHTIGRQGPTLELPNSLEGGIPNNLRAAKSFADLRTHSPSPAPSGSSYAGIGNGLGARYGDYGSLATPPNMTPTSGQNPGASTDTLLSGGMGSLSLGYDPTGSHLRSTPGAIGSQRPIGGNTSAPGRAAPDRQPRGPEWGEAFNSRNRGHMQRNSDSSDAGSRTASSRFH